MPLEVKNKAVELLSRLVMPILINLLPTVYILSIFFRKVYILFTKKEICLNDIGLSENVKICKQT